MPPRNKRRGARSTPAHVQPPKSDQRDQYQHAIPRFILRRFQAGPRKTKAVRRAEYRRTGEDPDQVLYYNCASGSLTVRSVGTIYGQKNLYRDASSPSNVNEVEEKLSFLERKAALTIETLHSELARGKITIKRRDLDDLRKFMFVLHYRNMGSTYFDPKLSPSIRQWLIRYQTEHQCQTHVDVWLHVMRYYLDTPHSQIVDDAHADFKKYGYEEVFRHIATGVDPIMEHSEAIAYQVQAEGHFLGIWEAEATSEFILTDGAAGLWEGLTPRYEMIHRIFVVSPRIALVLRSHKVALYESGAPMTSDLLSIPQEKPTSRLVNGETAIRLSNENDISEINRHRSPDDVFTFTVTKLTLDQTEALNTVLLRNMKYDGGITFLERAHMLRTLRVFWYNPLHKFLRQKYASLLRHLSIISQPLSHGSTSSLLEPVDSELYVALMGVVLNQTKFVSRYDRALSIYRLLQKTSQRRTCPFVTEHIYNLSVFMDSFRIHIPGAMFDNHSLRLKVSLPSELSLRIFTILEKFVSTTLDVKMDFDDDVLGKLGKEVALLAFLDRIGVEMPKVLINLKNLNGVSVMDILTLVKEAFVGGRTT
ncbi:uncharacterized protein BT62DRAFT_897718 [Guyanagaster necrorhizus]|uniref:Uncharacterized protein n=1 Tax=Guyanagaster necrorhizus TaxID=856835 RepID=A0A9P7VRG3_9AGAR|nr:uncharacterized protein BT62DRAFT_897718 [Guyanagaster necrorhizus MCA 3950]KAG7445313.1 hypothetical protein BT62DRAFT_897718 [Guyanagaster necrorhizus MCA 3950]